MSINLHAVNETKAVLWNKFICHQQLLLRGFKKRRIWNIYSFFSHDSSIFINHIFKTILLIFHDIGMNDKRCFRWEAPMKNYFQHLKIFKNIMILNPSPPPPPKKKHVKIKMTNSWSSIRMKDKSAIKNIYSYLIHLYNYPIQENSFI